MDNNKNSIALIGYSSGIGAGVIDCQKGASKLYASHQLDETKFHWINFLSPIENKTQQAALSAVGELNYRLANITNRLSSDGQFFVTIGGDHSSAIGTWSGVATSISPSPLGLIWIDAHLDSHTMETTPSGNIHGMPLAVLLGYGEHVLTDLLSPQVKLLPQNVCVVGVRSYEAEEQALLNKIGVKIIYMHEIYEKGIAFALNEAVNHVTKYTQHFGISFDLDAIDPKEAPGVGTPEPQGIIWQEFFEGFNSLSKSPKLIGAEIVEFNPSRDRDHKTETLIVSLLNQLYTNQIRKRA